MAAEFAVLVVHLVAELPVVSSTRSSVRLPLLEEAVVDAAAERVEPFLDPVDALLSARWLAANDLADPSRTGVRSRCTDPSRRRFRRVRAPSSGRGRSPRR
ncbi:MAG: hypothetical protein M3550_04655 [Actinomycetota bacterium]|nr:hypothetical protein [Actinomycetota bacterium]